MKCRVCLNKTELDQGGVCGRCAGLVDIVRKNLDGAAKSKLKPSKRIVKCETCGTPMKILKDAFDDKPKPKLVAIRAGALKRR